MKLESQVTSLELSKRLKELGVKQESLFYWTKPHYEDNLPFVCWYEEKFVNGTKNWEQYSAFTVAELGEKLEGLTMPYQVKNAGGYWYLNIPQIHEMGVKTEADARAKMLVYLLENNLIKN